MARKASEQAAEAPATRSFSLLSVLVALAAVAAAAWTLVDAGGPFRTSCAGAAAGGYKFWGCPPQRDSFVGGGLYPSAAVPDRRVAGQGLPRLVHPEGAGGR
ncbi:unnamed protein product [Phytophthora fragariaefolia]|uniref:Unnamed protein product n=1 Tax=Phytophthora fragariaefolia TaxID=1490495 RepID=A0A9W6XXC7_9STRA|nr:unnamed protein product [Phytophthora fragariaefolia]